MKTIIERILILSLFVTYASSTSLKDSVISTLGKNPDVLSEKLNRDAYQKYVDEEKGDYYPTLDFQGYVEKSRTRNDRDNVATDPSSAKKDGWHAALTFEQIIYDGGQTPSQVEQYKHTYLSNKYRSLIRVDEIVRSTIDNYLNAVKYQELIDLSQLNLQVHEDYLVIAQEKENISGEILETYQVNSKKHYVIDRYLEQKINEDEARNIFAEKSGIENPGNICRPTINEAFIPSTLEEAIEKAVRNSPKILRAIEDIKEQRENVVQANATYLPTLRFQWVGSLDDDLSNAENGRQDISRFRIIMDWNLFEGGKNKIAKEREVLFLQEKQKILDTTVNQVIQEVTTSYKKYFSFKEKIENYKKYVKDNYYIKEVYFKQLTDGTRTFIDILDAESEYYRSSLDLIDFEYQLYGYYYDILNHSGLLSTSILMSENQVCKEFKLSKYESRFKQKVKDNNSELNDLDLLQELGQAQSKTKTEEGNTKEVDMEIDNLINGTSVGENNETKNPDENAVKNLPTGKYTIKLATFDQNYDINSFIEKNKLNPDDVYAYSTNNNINVIYGHFNKLGDAKALLSSLDKSLINSNVYIDILEKHRKLYQKYKTNN
ncbi:MAG: TolC family protein [Halarcobacter sp.]